MTVESSHCPRPGTQADHFWPMLTSAGIYSASCSTKDAHSFRSLGEAFGPAGALRLRLVRIEFGDGFCIGPGIGGQAPCGVPALSINAAELERVVIDHLCHEPGARNRGFCRSRLWAFAAAGAAGRWVD